MKERLYMPANKKMNRAMRGTLAALSLGIKKQNPATSSVQAIFGKVNSRRLRRPNVSMV